MKRRSVLRGAAAGALAAAMTAGLVAPAFAAYPERPITLVVPWGAGGGTDAVGRFIASELEKELKQPINVVNRTGGSGVVGHSAIASAAPDGYTLGIITVEIAMMKHVGLTALGPADFTPLALVNFDPTAVMVGIDSPIKDVKGLLAAAKANPGKLKASGTGQGGIWHLGLAGMLVDAKLAGNAIGWVPSQGRRAGPAGSGRGRHRPRGLLAAGGAIADRGKEGAADRADVADAGRHLPGRAAAEEGDRQRLDDGRLARNRRPEGPAGGRELAS